MNIRAVVHDGRVNIPVPDELADGTEVIVTVTPTSGMIGLSEEEWDASPEGIDAWCERVRRLQPLVFTERELELLNMDHEFREKWEKENSEANANRLTKDWE